MDDAAPGLWARRVSGAAYFRNLAILESCPPLLADALAQRHASIAGNVRAFFTRDGRIADSWNDADADLARLGAELRQVNPERAFDDDAIEAAADQAARHCMGLRDLRLAVEYAQAQGLTLPHGPRVTSASLRRRLNSPDWWRRRLRTRLTRQCEELFRRLGFVRRQACAYVSGDALARMKSAAHKGRRWMSETLAVCEETGEAIPLEDIAARSLANPALRRGELMTRARGFQETAEAAGHRCLMVTLTAPSAFHAWLRESGERNPRYNGATPREAQAWLNKQWARARAALKRRNVLYYGFRAAEPHHDGTPHWHAVLYVPTDHVGTLTNQLRKTWLKEYPDEPGASKHRIKFNEENPSEGSGVGYLAKYVAKNIDGAGSIGGQASDESGRPVSDDAQHAIAWARLHGIRQFQQLGGPAVTLWRELRRVREPCDCPPLEALRLTTTRCETAGPSWSRFVAQLGGIEASLRASRALFDKVEPRCLDRQGRTVMRMTRWGELPAPMVVGLRLVWRDRIRRLATRVHVWFLVFAPRSGGLFVLGPVAITVRGAAEAGAPAGWTNPQETSQAPPWRGGVA